MSVDEESDGLGESGAGADAPVEVDVVAEPDAAAEPMEAIEVDDPGPPPLNPRQVRARRRRRRRQFGTLLFLLVAGGILATAYFAVAGNDDSDSKTSGSGATTTTAAPQFIARYKVTTGINVRQAPATTAAQVGAVAQGAEVAALCVTEGQSVTGGSQSTTQWLKVFGPWPLGYVSAAFVDTGDDLVAKKIPTCTA